VLAGLALLLQRVRLEAARGAAPPAERLLDELLRMLGPSTALSDAQCRAARAPAARAGVPPGACGARRRSALCCLCMCRAIAGDRAVSRAAPEQARMPGRFVLGWVER